MHTYIRTITDVEAFFNHLITNESLNFHPDEDFKNYINLETELPSYTATEADLRNQLMNQAFGVCERKGVDIYQIGLQKLYNQLTPKP